MSGWWFQGGLDEGCEGIEDVEKVDLDYGLSCQDALVQKRRHTALRTR